MRIVPSVSGFGITFNLALKIKGFPSHWKGSMELTYRGIKYDRDAGLKRYLYAKLQKEERLKRELERDAKQIGKTLVV